MTDDIWVRDEIESPCIKVCVIHPASRLCTGGLRTIDEITEWSRMTAAERRGIIDALPARQGQIAQRRGGRSRTR